MFALRDDDYIFRMMAIDNGSSFLGMVILDLDLRSGIYHLLEAETFAADKMISNHRGSILTHGARWARQCTLKDTVADRLGWWQPDAVPVESPFFQPGRVQSFEVLSEMKVILREAVEEYNHAMDIILVSPGEAKRAVQPKDFTMKKVVIKDCVLRLPNLRWSEKINIDRLTEHEYDSIAVGVAYGERIRRDCGFVR